jgi:hypothetical protein
VSARFSVLVSPPRHVLDRSRAQASPACLLARSFVEVLSAAFAIPAFGLLLCLRRSLVQRSVRSAVHGVRAIRVRSVSCPRRSRDSRSVRFLSTAFARFAFGPLPVSGVRSSSVRPSSAALV